MPSVSFKADLGPRRYDLDWVRIGAFMLLIFYHVGMYYVTWDFHVKSPHRTQSPLQGAAAGDDTRPALAG